MNLIDEVKQAEDESYDKWFERWFEKENLENTLKQSAMKGYTSFSYLINDDYSEYTQRRMRNKKFVKKLKDKLKGFNVYRLEPQRYERSMLGKRISDGWTDLKVCISWKEANS